MISKQILPPNTIRKRKESSRENLYFDTGAKRVKKASIINASSLLANHDYFVFCIRERKRENCRRIPKYVLSLSDLGGKMRRKGAVTFG